jgi:hypothetical protein
MQTISNIIVGQPDVDVGKSSHVRGVRQGNQEGSSAKQRGLIQALGMLRATAARSTGINADARNPIDPHSPNLPPA